MQFVTERVNFGQEILTIVFPLSKSNLLSNKIQKFAESKITFGSIERFVILNGGYIKESF